MNQFISQCPLLRRVARAYLLVAHRTSSLHLWSHNLHFFDKLIAAGKYFRDNYYGHWFLWDSLSQTSSTSPSFINLLGGVHWSRAQYSFCQYSQSWVARYWTLRHVLLKYWSSDSNFPGGGNTSWVLSVNKWFGGSGSGAAGSERFFTVRGTAVDNTLGFCRKCAKGFAIELGAMI